MLESFKLKLKVNILFSGDGTPFIRSNFNRSTSDQNTLQTISDVRQYRTLQCNQYNVLSRVVAKLLEAKSLSLRLRLQSAKWFENSRRILTISKLVAGSFIQRSIEKREENW